MVGLPSNKQINWHGGPSTSFPHSAPERRIPNIPHQRRIHRSSQRRPPVSTRPSSASTGGPTTNISPDGGKPLKLYHNVAAHTRPTRLSPGTPRSPRGDSQRIMRPSPPRRRRITNHRHIDAAACSKAFMASTGNSGLHGGMPGTCCILPPSLPSAPPAPAGRQLDQPHGIHGLHGLHSR